MNEALTDRIGRLLTLVEESRRTHQLQEQQLQALRSERNNLQFKLKSVSQRIDAILQRIPSGTSPAEATAETTL